MDAQWKLRTFDACPAGVIVTNKDRVILYASTKAEEMFGALPGQLIGQPVRTLVPTIKRDKHDIDSGRYAHDPMAQERSMAEGRNLQAQRIDNLEVFPADIALTPVRDDETGEVQCFIAWIYPLGSRQMNRDVEWFADVLKSYADRYPPLNLPVAAVQRNSVRDLMLLAAMATIMLVAFVMLYFVVRGN